MQESGMSWVGLRPDLGRTPNVDAKSDKIILKTSIKS